MAYLLTLSHYDNNITFHYSPALLVFLFFVPHIVTCFNGFKYLNTSLPPQGSTASLNSFQLLFGDTDENVKKCDPCLEMT